MSKSIKGTQTEKNLLTSFAGESQARMRYTYFASVAKKEGYEQISAIFTETADQEKEHAKRMFKFLEGGMVESPPLILQELSALHWRIYRLPLQANMKSGRWTILTLPMLPSRKAFLKLPPCTVIFPLQRKDTKNATALLYRTLKMLLFSLRKAK